MTQYKNMLVLLTIIASLLLSACGAASENTPAEDNKATQEETTASTAIKQKEAIAQEEPTAEATAEGEATAEAEATAEGEATAEATAETSVETEEELDFSHASTLEEIESIKSFRMQMELKAEGEAFAEEDAESAQFARGVSMEGKFIKEPAAQHIKMSFGEGEESGFGVLEFIQIDEKGYANFGGQWIETPTDQSPQIDEISFISPKDLGDDINQFERVGEETINGRETVYLYADKEILGNLSTSEDDLGLAQAEEAQLDLWIDKEEGFIVKMNLVAKGVGLNEEKPEASGQIEMTINYSDFNGDFKIEAPEVSSP